MEGNAILPRLVRSLPPSGTDGPAGSLSSQPESRSSPRPLAAVPLRISRPETRDEREPRPTLVGVSTAIRQLRATVEKVGPRDVTVLVTGETGTGKELVSSMLHEASGRAGRPLVSVNCGAIPRDLAESELFGHVRGAFTGALQPRRGFFGAADSGTLVLDEVEALPLEAQAKLLRAVEQGEVQTVGADYARKVDVRVIACTNTELRGEVKAGRFRQDLYYRLAVVSVVVPPLRARPEDIPVLAAHFAELYSKRFRAGPVRFGEGVLEELQSRPWPGNVRELENAIASMVALCDGGVLAPVPELCESDAKAASSAGDGLDFRSRVKAFERALLLEALAASGNNRSGAARQLGLSRTTLLGLLERHGLQAGA
jgi:DNA-binding NtrC family response regulator